MFSNRLGSHDQPLVPNATSEPGSHSKAAPSNPVTLPLTCQPRPLTPAEWKDPEWLKQFGAGYVRRSQLTEGLRLAQAGWHLRNNMTELSWLTRSQEKRRLAKAQRNIQRRTARQIADVKRVLAQLTPGSPTRHAFDRRLGARAREGNLIAQRLWSLLDHSTPLEVILEARRQVDLFFRWHHQGGVTTLYQLMGSLGADYLQLLWGPEDLRQLITNGSAILPT